MGLRALCLLVAVVLVSGVWSWEGDHVRADRTSPEVKIAAANTEADSDIKARDGMASSSSSTKGSAAFISKYPHPDIHHHHEEKEDHFRSVRSVDSVKIALADTDAKSDSKSGHGMAASRSSTKGSAAFVSKNRHGKHRRSTEDVEVAAADTDAKSDSKADHGKASSSSSTKGSAAFISKHHHGKHRRSTEDVEVAAADTDAKSDSKAKNSMAASSSSSKGSAAFVTEGHNHEEKEIPHDHPEKGDEAAAAEETYYEEKEEIIPREPFVDPKQMKGYSNKMVEVNVDF